MQENQNIEIVKRVYAGFRSKDLPSILELQSDDSDWSVAGSPDKIPWASPGKGHAGVTSFLKILGGLLVAEVFEIRDYLARDNKVVALGFQKGVVRTTNVPFAFDFVHVWELRDGKVTKFRVYYDTDYVAGVLKKNH